MNDISVTYLFKVVYAEHDIGVDDFRDLALLVHSDTEEQERYQLDTPVLSVILATTFIRRYQRVLKTCTHGLVPRLLSLAVPAFHTCK